MERDPSFREVWLALIAARARKRFTQVALVLMVAVAVWKFMSGDYFTALFVLAVAVFTLTHALTALAIGIAFRIRARRGLDG